MASISYWFLSPSLLVAIAGKLRGWDRTTPTPETDWKQIVVDVVLPAKNEEESIVLALSSLTHQDFPYRHVVVFDDGSTDRTSEVVEQYSKLSGRGIQLIRRDRSIGKTPALREFCEHTDADAVVILDADTVLTSPNYISRLIEELFKNAGVSAAFGEVTPLTEGGRNLIAEADAAVQAIQAQFELPTPAKRPLWSRVLNALTILYRAPLYILLQRTLYDGMLKLLGGQLNPIGCAVAYKTARLRECFAYAQPRVGDNLSMSEDIYIGHFFNWKGYRSLGVTGVRCETAEPPITRLPFQLFLWSSAFLQSAYYFSDLPLSPVRFLKSMVSGTRTRQRQSKNRKERKIREQYRAAWGEEVTRERGRPVGIVEFVSLVEKLTYPLLLLYCAFFSHMAFFVTIGLEAMVCMLLIAVTADRGTRLKYAAMIVPATPIRLMSMGIDMFAALRCLTDLASGNRNWKK